MQCGSLCLDMHAGKRCINCDTDVNSRTCSLDYVTSANNRCVQVAVQRPVGSHTTSDSLSKLCIAGTDLAIVCQKLFAAVFDTF